MRDPKLDLKDNYIRSLFSFNKSEFDHAKKASDSFQLSGISVSFAEASLLRFLVQQIQSKKHVEIGTLTGFSALMVSDGMSEGGEIWTFEKSSTHAQAARDVFAGRDSKNIQIHLIEGDAEETLPGIENKGPFDSIFIDGNKGAYGRYLDWSEKNLRKGGLILADNVFLGGSVYTVNGDEENGQSRFSSKQVEVMKDVNRRLADPKRYRSVLVPTAEGLFIAEKLF